MIKTRGKSIICDLEKHWSFVILCP